MEKSEQVVEKERLLAYIEKTFSKLKLLVENSQSEENKQYAFSKPRNLVTAVEDFVEGMRGVVNENPKLVPSYKKDLIEIINKKEIELLGEKE